MPFLDWYGRKAVENYHHKVPYHLLKRNDNYSVGEPGSGNLVVQGDNLVALKALLPYYAGQVKCIYIDPPYNTGTENWVYNDNVNSPEIKQWLGKVVGKEAEDLSRHDKWLCMMYPRLQLLKQFLREDGAIFVSIDDNEQHHLRMIMDEIFGTKNFVANIIWQKKYSPQNDANYFSDMHDFILCYAKNKGSRSGWKRNLLPQTEAIRGRYSNPDNDPRGPWKAADLTVRTYTPEYDYPIITPSGRVTRPARGRCWMTSQKNMQKYIDDGRIWFGQNGSNKPALKKFLSEVQEGVVPSTIWTYNEVGHNQQAKQELKNLLEDQSVGFETPKPVALIQQIIRIATEPDDLILDSFAGSGSTGHAVLSQNAEDGGSRRFILVEMEEKICQTVTTQRMAKAINGYAPTRAGRERVPGLGGGFDFCQLGEPLFTAEGRINESVTYANLAQHLFFIETGTPLERGEQFESPLIGIHNDTAIYLLYNGILKDKSVQGGNVLTTRVWDELPSHNGPKVIYGTSCRIGPDRLKRLGIVFKQIPYEVRGS